MKSDRRRLCLVTQFLPPETNAGANRVGAMADALADVFDLRVTTLQPSYPDPTHFAANQARESDVGRTFPIRRMFAFQPHRGGLVGRALREYAMAARLAAASRRPTPAIVLASSPSTFLGPTSLALARWSGARFVWDLRDMHWRYAIDSVGGSATVRFLTAVVERHIRRVLARADLVVTPTPGIASELAPLGVDESRVHVVPNGVSQELLDALASAADSEPPRTPPVVSYIGVLGYAQALHTFVEAAARLPDVQFRLVGDGPERKRLELLAASLRLGNLYFDGYQDRQGVVEAYRRSHVLFAQVKDGPTLSATALPSKIFECLASGRPLIYSGSGHAPRWLEQTGTAWVIPPEDPSALATTVSALLETPDRCRTVGLEARQLVAQRFQRETLMRDFAQFLAARYS